MLYDLKKGRTLREGLGGALCLCVLGIGLGMRRLSVLPDVRDGEI